MRARRPRSSGAAGRVFGATIAFTLVFCGCGTKPPPASNSCAVPPKPEPEEKPKKDDFGVCTDTSADAGLDAADAADAP